MSLVIMKKSIVISLLIASAFLGALIGQIWNNERLQENLEGNERSLGQCQEQVRRLNFPDLWDRCAQNPEDRRVYCERCIRGKCEDVYEWFAKHGYPDPETLNKGSIPSNP